MLSQKIFSRGGIIMMNSTHLQVMEARRLEVTMVTGLTVRGPRVGATEKDTNSTKIMKKLKRFSALHLVEMGFTFGPS